jgi:hypothetical protein
MIPHYTRQYAYHTLFDIQFESGMYSYPDRQRGGWKWIAVRAMYDWHLRHAIKLQMLAIQGIEEALADLFTARGTEQNHKDIDKSMRRMSMRYKRLSMLGNEYARRTPNAGPFEERPEIKDWFEGSTRLDGKYPEFEPVLSVKEFWADKLPKYGFAPRV